MPDNWIQRGPWWRYRVFENRVVIQAKYDEHGWRTITHRSCVAEAETFISQRRVVPTCD